MKIYKLFFIGIFIITTNLSFAKCIILNKVAVDSNIDIIFDKYYGKCIDKNIISSVIKDVNNYLINQGFITSKAFLPKQNIKDGILNIGIFYGKVNSIIDKRTNKPSNNTELVFLGQKDKTLNLRKLESSIEKINQVPSTNADFKLIPSSNNGSDILVNIKQDFPLRLTLGKTFDETFEDANSNISANFYFDNPLSINDILSYTRSRSGDQDFYDSSINQQYSYSFPISDYDFNLGYSESEYRSGVDGINAKYLANGNTRARTLGISKIIARDKNNKYIASINLSNQDSKNYFANSLIGVSSYETTKLITSLEYNYFNKWGSINASFAVHNGLDLFGARDDDYISNEVDSPNQAKLEFSKYTLTTNLNYNLPYSITLNSKFHMQYTQNNLYDSDKLTIGGSNSVRGYSGVNLTTDNGFYFNNTFNKKFNLNLSEPIFKAIDLGVGIDYGRVRSGPEITGLGAKLTFISDSLGADFSWGRALKRLSENQDKDTFSANINWSF